MMRTLLNGAGALAMFLTLGACGPLGGDCGDPEPELLVSGTYTFDHGYSADAQGSPLGEVGDGTFVLDRESGTATMTYTQDGEEVTHTFTLTNIYEASN